MARWAPGFGITSTCGLRVRGVLTLCPSAPRGVEEEPNSRPLRPTLRPLVRGFDRDALGLAEGLVWWPSALGGHGVVVRDASPAASEGFAYRRVGRRTFDH